MTQKKTIVLKFGGSVLRSEADLPNAVHEIYRHWRRGSKVLAVVSAFGGTTNELVQRATSFGDEQHLTAHASLVATGETTTAALLTLAIQRVGLPVKLLSPEQVGLLTSGNALDAVPISADRQRIADELERATVVVSGFAGVDDDGNRTLLGRGGSDLTALFLAETLDARCRLIKDVDGLFESDPRVAPGTSRRFSHASYETVRRVGGEVVQPKAVEFASANCLEFEIGALASTRPTTVGEHTDELDDLAPFERPLRVALLGCGTVGGGVYERLVSMPSLFEVTGVVNIDPAKAIESGISGRHIRRDPIELIDEECDVVVELIGGIEPARSLVRHALDRRRHVITANKALIATCGDLLDELAIANGVSIRYSAAVGGSLPALEAVTAAAERGPIRSVSGIINGTCNFICDRLASGVPFAEAVLEAQTNGYAEADPTFDLDGTDAAQKLILLARAAFGENLSLDEIERTGIENLSQPSNGTVWRLVAEFGWGDDGVRASVAPHALPESHPFAQTRGADNSLIIEFASGEKQVLRGRGAGRHATTESVLADLFDLREHLQTRHSTTRVENHKYLEVTA